MDCRKTNFVKIGRCDVWGTFVRAKRGWGAISGNVGKVVLFGGLHLLGVYVLNTYCQYYERIWAVFQKSLSGVEWGGDLKRLCCLIAVAGGGASPRRGTASREFPPIV